MAPALWLLSAAAALLGLARPGCAATKQEIWVLSIQSLSCSKGWCAGPSVVVAAELMLEEIRRNPDLLPGYDLKVLHADDACDPSRSLRTFFEGMFNQRYTIMRPGQDITKMDLDGDGMIRPEELDTLFVTWNSTEVPVPPVAVLGMGCSPTTRPAVQPAYYMRLPMLSSVATFAGLSDRTTFPNFFRLPMPDSFSTYAFVDLVLMLGHRSTVAVTDTGPDWPLTVVKFAEFADERGLELLGKDYREDIEHFRGLRVSVDTPDTYTDAVSWLIKLRQRMVILLIYLGPIQKLLCAAFRQAFFSAVYMAFGWLEMGWWHRPGATTCTADEMTLMTKHFFAADQITYRLDSHTRHSCSVNMTGALYQQEWFGRQGLQQGSLAHPTGGYSLVDYAAPTADAVCMLALMLQDLLYVRNISLADLSARKQHAYDAAMDSMAKTDFEGFGGRIRYSPGKADRTGTVRLEQLQNGALVMFATYADGNFTLLGRVNLTLHFPGETFFAGPEGASKINGSLTPFRAACDERQILNFTDNKCYGCPPDTEYVEFAQACLCRRGYHLNGTCVPCPAGTFSADPGASCKQCERGKHQAQKAQTMCIGCLKGTYAAEPGRIYCQSCPGHQTTEHHKSESAADCKCKVGSFSSAGDNSSCELCPEGSMTAGLGSLAESACECLENTFMNRTGFSNMCDECPPHLLCHKGSWYQSGTSWENLELEPSFWSSTTDPMSVYRCRDWRRCIGGHPEFACAPRLRGTACEHCDDDYYWDGNHCQPCEDFQKHSTVFPVLPILLIPLIIISLYTFFGDDLPRWGSWQNTTTAVFFIVLNHYQIVSMLPPPSLSLPNELQEPYAWFPVTTDPTLFFSLECVGLGGLFLSMSCKAATPLLVIMTGVLLFYASRVAARFSPRLAMEPHRLFNVIASIMFTCFGAVSSMSLLLFKCSSNPNGKMTLAVDMSIVCWSSAEWKSVLGIGIACVVVYIIFMGSAFVYAICLTPRCFCEESFRMRWKFLFIKFHAGAFWWGIIFLGKNFLLTLVPVVVSDSGGVAHCYLSMAIVLVYLSWVVTTMPYRANIANFMELVAGVCILAAASLLTWFLPGRGLPSSSSEEEGRYIAVATLVVNLLPMALLPVCVALLAAKGRASQRSEWQVKKAQQSFELLKHSYEAFVLLDPEAGTETLLTLAEGEVRCLLAAALVIRSDVLGSSTRQRVASSKPERSQKSLSTTPSLRSQGSGVTRSSSRNPNYVTTTSTANDDVLNIISSKSVTRTI